MKQLVRVDLALFAVAHTSKLVVDCVYARLEDYHYELTIVSDDKVQLGAINAYVELV